MAWPVRYNMIGLLFLTTVVNYIDRVNIIGGGASYHEGDWLG